VPPVAAGCILKKSALKSIKELTRHPSGKRMSFLHTNEKT
jgi:hypothetical protein